MTSRFMPSPRSQSPSGNAPVRATPSLQPAVAASPRSQVALGNARVGEASLPPAVGAAEPPSRSQISFGNAIVRATSLPPRTEIGNKIWEREKSSSRPQKTPRHPERSEANDPLSPERSTRAQSKDLANFPSGHRSGAESLDAGPARRQEMKMPFPATTTNGETPRSFDCGSATPSGKTPAPLASAQDDGILKSARPVGSSEAAQTNLPSAGPFPSATWEQGEEVA